MQIWLIKSSRGCFTRKTATLAWQRGNPMHWAAQYIGKAWSPSGDLKTSFNCYQLCCVVQRNHYSREMPEITLGRDPWGGINASSWRVTTDAPGDGDVLSMQGSSGPHVGTVITVNLQLFVLHAVGSVDSPGSVIATPLSDLQHSGFSRIKTWRPAHAQST